MNDRSVAVDGAGNVGDSTEAGPSNAAPSETESGKKKVRDGASVCVSESITTKITDSKRMVEKSSSVNADTQISISVTETS